MKDVTEYARAMLFSPYIYAGNAPFVGIDCSGFVCELGRAFGLLRPGEDLTAQGLFEKFSKLPESAPGEGSLLWFGKSTRLITHVAYAISTTRMIEAGGGDQTTRDIPTAARQIAMVRERPIKWRSDLVSAKLPLWLTNS